MPAIPTCPKCHQSIYSIETHASVQHCELCRVSWIQSPEEGPVILQSDLDFACVPDGQVLEYSTQTKRYTQRLEFHPESLTRALHDTLARKLRPDGRCLDCGSIQTLNARVDITDTEDRKVRVSLEPCCSSMLERVDRIIESARQTLRRRQS